ncbi:MAG: ATP-binding protein [Thermoplasmata archaeon]
MSTVGEEEEDRELFVKCPTCGRVAEGCEHISGEDLAALRRLIRAGVSVYENEEEAEEEELFEPSEEEAKGTELYQVLQPRFTLEDVVLTEGTREAIEDALVELRHKWLIFEAWGLSEVIRKRKGLSLLFAGPPGTGKTMTAEALAHAMGKPLMVVNYAHLENMWVGETEKNIERVFQNAWNEDAVLFFDEADAVFHRRGQTAAPWANRDVNVLLSRLEDFPGMIILATNLTKVLDRALDRRIDIPVEFEMPDAGMREAIYRKLMPRLAPMSGDVDFGELARKHRLSGGHILNVIRQAMRYAARRDGIRRIVTMDDLEAAAKREVAKAQVMNRNHLEEEGEGGPGKRVAYHG